jgi:hypothetical protein
MAFLPDRERKENREASGSLSVTQATLSGLKADARWNADSNQLSLSTPFGSLAANR